MLGGGPEGPPPRGLLRNLRDLSVFGVFFFFGVSYGVYYVAPDGEGLFGGAWRFEAYAYRSLLPGGWSAGGVGRRVVGEPVAGEQFFQDRLSAVELGDDGEDFFTVVGDAAVADVVAIPGGGGVESVEFGEIDGGDFPGEAIDEEPSPTLPLPARSGIVGQAVVEAEGATSDEHALGHFMRRTNHVFLDASIHEQRANFQSEGFFAGGFGARGPLNRGPLSVRDDMNPGGGRGADRAGTYCQKE